MADSTRNIVAVVVVFVVPQLLMKIVDFLEYFFVVCCCLNVFFKMNYYQTYSYNGISLKSLLFGNKCMQKKK